MKNLISLLLTAWLSICASHAASNRHSVIEELMLNEFVAKTIPTLEFKAGDKGKNGGMGGNHTPSGVGLDIAESFTVFTLRKDAAPLTAPAVAKSIMDAMIKEYELPTTEPSHRWVSKTPEGIDPNHFSMEAIATSPFNNQRDLRMEYITIRVVVLPNSDFQISLHYTSIDNNR